MLFSELFFILFSEIVMLVQNSDVVFGCDDEDVVVGTVQNDVMEGCCFGAK